MLLISSAYGLAQNPPPSLTTIYNFTGAGDGGYPGRLVIGEDGVLYGTTKNGGAYGVGTVFSVTPPASPGGAWIETVLYSFRGGSDGASPNSPLLIGSGGALYGTTSGGGNYFGTSTGNGTAFSLTPPAPPGGRWTEEVIHTFCVTSSDGCVPTSGLAVGPEGVLYGTTYEGPNLNGTVYALVPPESPGASWTESVIYDTSGSGGWRPTAGVTVGSGRALYGAAFGEGTGVFTLAPPATPGRAWVETAVNPVYCTTGVVIGAGGVLYGASPDVVFSLAPPASPGGAWTYAVLHSFPCGSPTSCGESIPGPLTIGQNGTLYGTTGSGGSPSLAGTAYALKPPASPGGQWTGTLLHTFAGSDGAAPTGLVIGSGGVLYGTTTSGGAYGAGTVFALSE